MHRRTFLGTASAGALVVGIPLPAIANDPRVKIGIGVLKNPHAGIALEWIEEQLRNNRIYFREESYIDRYLILRNPKFKVEADTPVWNARNGSKLGPGLSITIFEKNIEVFKTKIATWPESSGAHKIPEYFVRLPFLGYEEGKPIRQAIGEDRFGYDIRFLKQSVKALKANASG